MWLSSGIAGILGLLVATFVSPSVAQTQCIANVAAQGTSDAITSAQLPCGTTTNLVILTAAAANATTTPTYAPTGSPPLTIIRPNGLAVLLGDLQPNYVALLTSTGTNWILLNPALGFPSSALTPGTTVIVPKTSGGVLWDNNGVLADSLVPITTALATALPLLTTSQLYGGTSGAGVAQHFPAGIGVETALQAAVDGVGGLASHASIAPYSNNQVYVSPSGSDSNDCLGWNTACLTLNHAEGLLAGKPSGMVNVGGGTYSLSATYNKEPNVATICTPGAVITQANSAGLNNLIDFVANSANSGSIWNCTIDGNYANNALNPAGHLVNIGSANDVTVQGNKLQNGTGYGVYHTTGLRPKMLFNKVTNIPYTPIISASTTTNTNSNEQVIGNVLTGVGAQAIVVEGQTGATVTDNNITGSLTAVTTADVSVVSSTATITATAAIFSSTCGLTVVCPGQYVITNGGGASYQEMQISSVTSANVAVATGCGSCSNATAATAVGGSGDLLRIGDSKQFIVANNQVSGSVGAGIIIDSGFISPIVQATQQGVVTGNQVYNIGGFCIGFESTGTGGPAIFGINVAGNNLTRCVHAGNGVYANGGGITFEAGASAPIYYILVGNNTVDDYTSTMPYWLALNGESPGQIVLGMNYTVGAVNAGIYGTGYASAIAAGGTLGTFAYQDYASPPAIGGTTPNIGAFTTLSASSTVSGSGFSAYLASPPAIGGSAPAAVSATAVTATSLSFASVADSKTAPTISSGCGGGSPSISAPNGTDAFDVTIGTASGSTCVLTMPTATTAWNCFAEDITTHTAANSRVAQTAGTTNSVTVTDYSDITGAATWVSGDHIRFMCRAY